MPRTEPQPGTTAEQGPIDALTSPSGSPCRGACNDHPDLGLYVHFPWCVKKCPYCDFNSHPLNGDLPEDAYVRAITSEFHARTDSSGRTEDRPAGTFDSRGWRFDTLFFGGGTPSLISAPAFATLIDTFGPYLQDDAEITMEANPGAAERDGLAAYRDAGVNRLSIGAQSFSPTSLKRLGRIHGPDEIGICVETARRGGFDNINLDLMYGLPGQTPDGALADLAAAVALRPEHLSWYQLTIEPRTEFARRPPRNLPDEESVFELENAGRALLDQAGFSRYEVSAYALPGAACRHNLVYWTFGDYLGLGAGAHGKFGSSTGLVPDDAGRSTIRTHNPRQPRLYLQDPCHTEIARVEPVDLPGEFMMNALRLVGGVERDRFEARTGLPWRDVEATWNQLGALGLVEDGRIAATPHGLQHLDSLIQHFLR